MAEVSIMRGGITLAAIAAVCTALVAATYTMTDERIAANEQAWLEQSLQPALRGLSYDGGVSESRLTIPAPNELPGPGDATVYRVYSGSTPVAALYVVSARDGYSGPIRLLVGVEHDGTISGVHVLDHRETPGLGDQVESSKSDWVDQFVGRSLTEPAAAQWKIKRDGGAFDQLTGASVTPRAIVKAVRRTLEYHAVHADSVFAAQADREEDPQP